MKGVSSLTAVVTAVNICLVLSVVKVEGKAQGKAQNDELISQIVKSHPNFVSDGKDNGILTEEELSIIKNKLSQLEDDQIQRFVEKIDTMDADSLNEFIKDVPRTQDLAGKTLFRRTCWCDLKWGPYNNPNDVNDMYQMYHFEPTTKSILFDLTCRDMLRECRGFCKEYAHDFFHQTVPVIAESGGIRACHHFSSTILRTDSRHIFLTYKADHCQDTVHEYLGEVCCWKCNTGERIRYNHGCKNNPPEDCELFVR